MKLAWKVYLASFGFVFLTAILLSLAVSRRESRHSLSELREKQKLLATIAASQVEAGYHEKIWPFEMLGEISKEKAFLSWQVVDGDLRVVLESRSSKPSLKEEIDYSPDDDGLILDSSGGREAFVVPMRMRTKGRQWKFRLNYHTRSLAENRRRIISTNMLYAIVISLILIPFTVLMVRRFLDPLGKLTHAVRELEAGRSGVDLPPAGSDEIGQLVTSFSAMEASIRDRDNEIRRHNDELEETVSARTQQIARTNAELRVEISERERAEVERERLNQELLDLSHQAGMAEVATNVLHDVGNVLNSINVSATYIRERVSECSAEGISRAVALLEKNRGDLTHYINQDERGKLLPGYLEGLARHLEEENRTISKELDRLGMKVDHVKEVVGHQQSLARAAAVLTEQDLSQLIDEAIQLVSYDLGELGVTLSSHLIELPPVTLEKHKFLQILVNLLTNAKQAASAGPGEKLVNIELASEGKQTVIRIQDDGVGIASDDLDKLFKHGFTTKKNGHGFGLHGSALAANSMGGSLRGTSDGLGKGATFELRLPLKLVPTATKV